MPKRRSRAPGGGGGGAAGAAALADEAADRAFAEAVGAPSGLEEEAAPEEEAAGREPGTPISALLGWLEATGRGRIARVIGGREAPQPISREEVARFNELWAMFARGEINDPDLAELYAMALGRLELGRRRLQEAARRSGGGAGVTALPEYSDFALRLGVANSVAAEMARRWSGFAPPPSQAEAARLAEEIAQAARPSGAAFRTLRPQEVADAAAELAHLSGFQRAQARMRWTWFLSTGEDLPEAELFRLYRQVAAEAEAARPAVQETMVADLPAGEAVARFARWDEAMERVRAVEEAARRRGLRFDPLPDPLGERAAEHMARALSRQGVLAQGGGVADEGGAEPLPPPPAEPQRPDRPVVFWIPRPERAARLREHLAACGIREYGPHGAPVPPGTVVVNYGAASRDELRGCERAAERLNAPFAVRDASDKLRAVRLLGELAPRTVGDPALAGQLGSEYIVAKRSRGSRGGGKELFRAADLERDPALRRRLLRYDHFQEYIPDREEYRVNLLGDEVLTAYRKAPPEREGPRLGGHRGFELQRSMPRAALEAAREARRRVGLDLAGVDLVYDRRRGRWYVLEVNSAPGMGPITLRRLLEALAARRRP